MFAGSIPGGDISRRSAAERTGRTGRTGTHWHALARTLDALRPTFCSQSTPSFTFSSARTANFELAILVIDGSARANTDLPETQKKRHNQMLDGNRENVAKAVMKHLNIPSTLWGDAVEPRPLHTSTAYPSRGR